MKTRNLLSLFITAVVCAACTASPSNVSPSISTSPSASASASVDPSMSPSSSPMPSSSMSPSASPSAIASASTTPVSSSCVELTVGQVYDASVLNNCPPTVKVGTKWTYSVVGIPGDVSTEITGINGNQYTVHTKGPNFDKTTTSTTTYDVQSDAKFTYKGKENVTVASGSYSDTNKFTTTQTQSGATTNLTYWMAKGVGAVKVQTETSVSGYNISTTTELKSFTP